MTGSLDIRGLVGRVLRYAGVSILFSVLGFIGLAILIGLLGAPVGWANFAVVALSIPPAFELNRRWVWARRGEHWWATPEILPFGLFSFAALVLSTVVVHLIGSVTADANPAVRTVLAEAGNLASFGSLWAVQFIVLERMWATKSLRSAP